MLLNENDYFSVTCITKQTIKQPGIKPFFSQNRFTCIIFKENWHYTLSYKRKREKTRYFVAIAFKCSLILNLIMEMFAQEVKVISFSGESLSWNHSVAAM